MKLKLPEAFAVAVAVDAPVSVTVAPLPADEGVIVPEIVQVCWAVAVKFTPVTFAALIVTV